MISAGGAGLWGPVQGGRDSHQVFSLRLKQKLQAVRLLKTKIKIV